MKKFGIFLIALGLALFLGPMVSRDLSFMSWTNALDTWGPLVGNMMRTVIVMLGIVLALSSK